jgi:hypothetical protein
MRALNLTTSAGMAVLCLVAAGNRDIGLAVAAWATSSLLLWHGLQDSTERRESLARTRRLDRW